MPQFGSNQSMTAQNLSSTQDINGNAIISSDNTFGASPLGIAARTQALYGLPNGHFDLTCPDPNSPVEVNNAIPYWDLEYSGAIATTMVYNATTQNWSVRMDPTGAEADDFVTLKARTFLLNDDAIALRQKAFASLTKVGTTGTAQWSIVLSATYYDQTGAQLSTYNIGTAADTGTWTGINGVTTSGSAAIDASAAYADIALTLTAAGSVSGTAKVDINSVLIGTSEAAAGGGGFLLSETFLTSGTWTRPTGVDYVDVVMLGAGPGGGNGGWYGGTATTGITGGGLGGQYGGAWGYFRDIYVGDVGSVSVGVGSGGAGAAGTVITKNAGTNTIYSGGGVYGSNGGSNTFGSYITLTGSGSAAAGTFSTNFFSYGGGTINGTPNVGGIIGATGGAPFTRPVTTGNAGGAGTSTSTIGTVFSSSAGGTVIVPSLGLGAPGGRGGNAQISSTAPVARSTAGSDSGPGAGAGGGGASVAYQLTGTVTMTATGGTAGDAIANTGSGGGGSGAVFVRAAATPWSNATVTITVPKGGDGAAGFVTVIWIG